MVKIANYPKEEMKVVESKRRLYIKYSVEAGHLFFDMCEDYIVNKSELKME